VGTRRRHTGRVTRHTPELAEHICGRMETGESLNVICSDLSLPCRKTIQNWRTSVPGFKKRYDLARWRQREAILARSVRPQPGPVSRYTEDLAKVICGRLAAGESLRAICSNPRMPCMQTVMNWVDTLPAFRAAYARARDHQAHALADEILQTVRRDDLPAADKQARLSGLKWLAGTLAAKKYGEAPDVPESGEGALFQVVIVKNGGMEGTG
jgi:hypothetical protein